MNKHVTITGPGEPADHVAIECAVMAELPAGAPLRTDLARRMDGWLGDFRDACGTFDESRFYAGAATIAAALARQEGPRPRFNSSHRNLSRGVIL